MIVGALAHRVKRRPMAHAEKRYFHLRDVLLDRLIDELPALRGTHTLSESRAFTWPGSGTTSGTRSAPGACPAAGDARPGTGSLTGDCLLYTSPSPRD